MADQVVLGLPIATHDLFVDNQVLQLGECVVHSVICTQIDTIMFHLLSFALLSCNLLMDENLKALHSRLKVQPRNFQVKELNLHPKLLRSGEVEVKAVEVGGKLVHAFELQQGLPGFSLVQVQELQIHGAGLLLL